MKEKKGCCDIEKDGSESKKCRCTGKGVSGDAGLRGQTGQAGKHGPSGQRGFKGVPGLKGDNGAPGQIGRKGPKVNNFIYPNPFTQ